MKKNLLAIAASLLISAPAITAADNTLTPAEQQDGWQLLFNGHDTSGWRGAKLTEFPAKGWVVEDG
ncbi:MAG: DUF1080 domain-containing protein, partial [Muribaculaceae bacterium]|nr:DUF1080 domain-containing protein [Muribaculaceae bacterium]